MCGIVGSLGPEPADEGIILRMADSLQHRGPDDAGVWLDAKAGIALAHRRLSIIDLSLAGHQPMVSSTGRYVISYNGEIYNHQDIRDELDAKETLSRRWRGLSDTETLLAGVEIWGFEATLKKLIGMFAVALWDKEKRVLYLARDRMGEKPLYYGWQKNVFLFGSELKALRRHPEFEGEIDRGSLAQQMRCNNVSAPYSIYRGIRKLPPGTFFKLTLNNRLSSSKDLPEPIPFWSLAEKASLGQQKPFGGNESEAIQALDHLLRDSVRRQMTADVPLGAFLSGGIDSSMVVALMQAQSNRQVKTFTIGFNEEGYNEAVHAKKVAQHLSTNHTELYVTPKEAIGVIPSLPTLYDEPFADSSQIPTFLVSQLTRQHVTVSLSGDAGDELFGGYNRYLTAMSLFRKFGRIPQVLRRGLSQVLSATPGSTWDVAGRLFNVAQPSDRMPKIIDILGVTKLEELYQRLVSQWQNPAEIVIGESDLLALPPDYTSSPAFNDLEHRMMYLDSTIYLPDDILVKVDRAAMGVSLETRVPFLDHRVVEFAWRLPLLMKIRNGQGKWILRQLLYKYVPKELIERPKIGFAVPIASWLRGPLREWTEDLLSESRLRREGYLHPAPIRKKWAEHLSGRHNWQGQLWNVLMFQAWLRNSTNN